MVAIIGDNRPHLYWAMAAAQSMGAVPVPLFQDAVAEEMHYVLDHAEARFAVVENQEQVDKVMSIKERCPNLEYIVYADPKGLRHYDFPFLFGVEELMARGAALAGARARPLRGRGRQGRRLRSGGDPLHLGHDRPPQGGDAQLRQHHRQRA